MKSFSPKSLLIAIFLLGHHCLLTYSQFRPDYTYHPEARAWFKIHKVPTTWSEARLKCYFEGGNLASPINDKLYSVMRSLMLVQFGPVFTGVHSIHGAGDYFSIEGVPLLQMPLQWAKLEPDNKNNQERSLAILPNGDFVDVKMSDVLPYICYRVKVGNETINSDCGTSVEGYELDPELNSCYKYHGDCVSWYRASMVCTAEGGHLVILNSNREAQLMIDRYANKPFKCNGDIISNAKRFWHVGCHNLDLDRAYWFTLDGNYISHFNVFIAGHHNQPGRRIEDAGYSTWANGQPSSNHEHCCTLNKQTNGLNDIDCGQMGMPFICEITKPKTRFNTN